ncbi:hypothetical protein RM844_15470 [Streptomyces sp. DSM 44915]|uniref:Uncharacterized protein n=1 Tax=Streptomyces chisholmiae TaxID=3075540 RepID=A0ABU2JRS1_9ACTN|nr:hypothetical protein [Streptomyces sp. DSM 44915]MDT0267685.1 hypothetical protein [Streptomyces sp. DSM 44915]
MRGKFTNAAVALAGASPFGGLGATAATNGWVTYATYPMGTLTLCVRYGEAVTGPDKDWGSYACWRDANQVWHVDLLKR